MNDATEKLLKASHLGKETKYISTYTPELLFPISRQPKRDEINVPNPLPFYGFDVWNVYELSWLNEQGKPQVAIGVITLPCDTPKIIESKSMKLYFNSLNNTKFLNKETVVETVKKDLSYAAEKTVDVNIQLLHEVEDLRTETFPGECIDTLDITIEEYLVNPNLLSTEADIVTESLYSNLLRSNCLATGQPDWGSVKIEYSGKKINRESLLKYIISFRNHIEFHEQCVERMFMDIMRECQPEQLTIEARYTRRGGIDINPIRSTNPNIMATNTRQLRQ